MDREAGRCPEPKPAFIAILLVAGWLGGMASALLGDPSERGLALERLRQGIYVHVAGLGLEGASYGAALGIVAALTRSTPARFVVVPLAQIGIFVLFRFAYLAVLLVGALTVDRFRSWMRDWPIHAAAHLPLALALMGAFVLAQRRETRAIRWALFAGASVPAAVVHWLAVEVAHAAAGQHVFPLNIEDEKPWFTIVPTAFLFTALWLGFELARSIDRALSARLRSRASVEAG
jgi:hypothetical protein